MAKKSSLASEIGVRIRNLRRQKKVTLIELSKITGVAQATLSRMETGLMLGTVKSHQKIAEALGISLGQLYGGIDARYERTRHLAATEHRKICTKTDQMKCELLTQEASKKKMTPLLITLAAHGRSAVEQLDRGVEKFLFILEGTVTARLEETDYTLNAYDTLYFDAAIPHQLVNSTGRQAKIFCAVSSSKI